MGDSKATTQYGAGWPDVLTSQLNAPSPGTYGYALGGISGAKVTNYDYAAAITTASAAATGTAFAVMVNLGVNDMPSMPSQATFQAAYLAILDAIHTKWPSVTVYVAKPWRRGYDTQANTMAGWIDTIVAARSSFAVVGLDERVWLKSNDNGAAYTSDGMHYSGFGAFVQALLAKENLGF